MTCLRVRDFDSVKVEPLSLSIVKDEAYGIDESYLSYYCRFMTLMLPMPPLSGVKCDLDMVVEVDFCACAMPDGALFKLIV